MSVPVNRAVKTRVNAPAVAALGAILLIPLFVAR
jgi:hypothetical protein